MMWHDIADPIWAHAQPPLPPPPTPALAVARVSPRKGCGGGGGSSCARPPWLAGIAPCARQRCGMRRPRHSALGRAESPRRRRRRAVQQKRVPPPMVPRRAGVLWPSCVGLAASLSPSLPPSQTQASLANAAAAAGGDRRDGWRGPCRPASARAAACGGACCPDSPADWFE
jgi:hypothetical protein